MIAGLRRRYAQFRGFDIDGSVVPAMDGPLSPNTALDAAAVFARVAAIDNVVAEGARVFASSGTALLSIVADGTAETIARYEAPIASLALAADGGLAIGLDGQGVRLRGGRFDGLEIRTLGAEALRCPTALCFEDDATLLIAIGSAEYGPGDWTRDLMTLGRSGSLWRYALATGEAKKLAEGLAYPAGVATDGAGAVYVSEAWAHRILRVTPDGRRQAVLDQLPAYPGRIVADGAGFWIALFAPRNQLVEFVLKEPQYRARMISEIDPALWIAPALSSGHSFRAPLQSGGVRKMNTLKPWSPSWSYGLVLRCDAAMRPVASYHSRADGKVHGVTALAATARGVMVAARGAGLLLRLDTTQTGEGGVA